MQNGKAKIYIANMRSLGDVFDMTPSLFESVAARYPDVADRVEVEFDYDLEGFEDGIRSAEILIGWEFPRDRIFDLAPTLRWIQLMGAGVDHVLPLDWLPANVKLTTAAGAHAIMAGEVLAMSVMMLNNDIPAFMTNQRQSRWQPLFSGPITGKTVLLIGVGGIGGTAAERCKALGMHVVGVRPSDRPHAAVDEMFGVDQLLEVLPRADFVIVSVPLTSQTRGLLGQREFELVKPGAGLINLGRHSIVDEGALIEALESGRLAGAIQDVEDPSEVPWDPRLWSTPNLLIIPHCATNDPATFKEHILEVFFENLRGYLAGEPMKTQVDPAREY